MTTRHPTNLPASIHQRLLNQAKQEKRPLQELLQYFAIERFLYRLSRSPHAGKFLLKGALMLRVWDFPLARPTLDVDLMGRETVTEERLPTVLREIFAQEVPEDGVRFDADSIRTQTIRVDANYQGIRARFIAHIGNMKLPMQVDVGFGDAIVPGPVHIKFPVLLDFPQPEILAYPPEMAVSEKFHAMVVLDTANSRTKDFYDIWTLARGRDFDGRILSRAIVATFNRRRTPLPTGVPVGLTSSFARDPMKQTQWNAFIRKGHLDTDGKTFEEIIAQIREFLVPPTLAVASGERFVQHWPPGGLWGAGVAQRND
ncbi:MAG: nucleotidyl transferase AbiEii/AbiGii toxin family protein [Nitrospirales bacterium]